MTKVKFVITTPISNGAGDTTEVAEVFSSLRSPLENNSGHFLILPRAILGNVLKINPVRYFYTKVDVLCFISENDTI